MSLPYAIAFEIPPEWLAEVDICAISDMEEEVYQTLFS